MSTLSSETTPSESFATTFSELDGNVQHHFIIQTTAEHVAAIHDLIQKDFVSFVPDNAFIIRCSVAYAKKLAKVREISWINTLPREFKVSPRLTEQISRLQDLQNESIADLINQSSLVDLFASGYLDLSKDSFQNAVNDGLSKARRQIEENELLSDQSLVSDDLTLLEDLCPVRSTMSFSSKFHAAKLATSNLALKRVDNFALLEDIHTNQSNEQSSRKSQNSPLRELTGIITGTSASDFTETSIKVERMVNDIQTSLQESLQAAVAQLLDEDNVNGSESDLKSPSMATFSRSARLNVRKNLRNLGVDKDQLLRKLGLSRGYTQSSKNFQEMYDSTSDSQSHPSLRKLRKSFLSPISPFLSTVTSTRSPSASTFTPQTAEYVASEQSTEKLTKNVEFQPLNIAISSPFLSIGKDELVEAIFTASKSVFTNNNATRVEDKDLPEEGSVLEYVTSLAEVIMSTSSVPVSDVSSSTMQDLAVVLSEITQVQSNAVATSLSDVIQQTSNSPDVFFLDVRTQFAISNARGNWVVTTGEDHITPTDKQTCTPFQEVGLTGKGHVVGVADTGLDVNSCYFKDNVRPSVPFHNVDEAVPSTTSAQHRKIRNYVTFVDSSDSYQGHGTHVAGSIAGYAVGPGNNPMTTDGLQNGVAPEAQISFFDLGSSRNPRILNVPENLNDLFNPAYLAGARIHSNSWGCAFSFGADIVTFCNTYDATSFYFDKYIREHPDFLVVVAAGNDGYYGYRTVGSPGTSKNALTIGSTITSSQAFEAMKSNPVDTKNLAESSHFMSLNTYYKTDHVASYSSRGPTFDGRIKPDLSAPGHIIESASASGTSAQSCRSHRNTGTSMATPIASGAATIVMDYLKKGYYPSGTVNPDDRFDKVSSSLLKAILLNSAKDLQAATVTGGQSPVPLPNQKNGPTVQNGDFSIATGQLYSVTTRSNIRLVFKASPSTTTGVTSNRRSYRLYVISPGSCFGSEHGSVVKIPSYSGSVPQTTPQKFSSQIFHVDLEGLEDAGHSAFKLDLTCNGRVVDHYIQVAEFDALTIDSAPRAREITCNTTVDDFIRVDINSSFPTFQFNCPVDSCREQHKDVLGASFYSTSSPICRSAIHAGVIDSTNQISTASSAGRLQGVAVFRHVFEYAVKLGSANWNGINSKSVVVERNQDIISFNLGSSEKVNQFNRVNLKPFYDKSGASIFGGFGLIQLSKALPLSSHYVNPDADVARGNIIIQANDIYPLTASTPSSAYEATHGSFSTQCFYIEPKEVEGTRKYTPLTCANPSVCAVEYDANSAFPVRSTLVWNDPQAFPNAVRMLTNDLDLYLFAPNGAMYYGNNNEKATSTTQKDTLNNVEQITVPNTTHYEGLYCVGVKGTYVPAGKQPYSLVSTGHALKSCQNTGFTMVTTPEPIPADDVEGDASQSLNAEPTMMKPLSGKYTISEAICAAGASSAENKLIQHSGSVYITQAGTCLSISAIPLDQSLGFLGLERFVDAASLANTFSDIFGLLKTKEENDDSSLAVGHFFDQNGMSGSITETAAPAVANIRELVLETEFCSLVLNQKTAGKDVLVHQPRKAQNIVEIPDEYVGSFAVGIQPLGLALGIIISAVSVLFLF